MKKEYPKYRQEEITDEQIYKALGKNEKAAVDKHISIKEISCGERKLADIKTSILHFLDIIEMPLSKFDIEAMRDYLKVLKESGRGKWTILGEKAHVKKFLGEHFKHDSDRFNNFEDFSLVKIKFDRNNLENKRLTTEEVEAIIGAAQSYRDKAMVCLLFESGARPQELRDLRWKDIKFLDNDITEINLFSSKTKQSRKFYVKASTSHLKRWRQEYANSNKRQ